MNRHPERKDEFVFGSETIVWKRRDEAAILRALAAIEDEVGRPLRGNPLSSFGSSRLLHGVSPPDGASIGRREAGR